jgi:hypothetical protein
MSALRRLIVSLCVGAAAALGALLIAHNQPGQWLAGVARLTGRPRDIFIHDYYFIIEPGAVLINVLAFSIVCYVILSASRPASGGARAGA